MNQTSLRTIASSNALSFTSFGSDVGSTFGDGFRGNTVLRSERFFELDRRESFYACTNHDSKMYDFDGRIVSNPRSTQPLIGQQAQSAFYVPLARRRPSAPLRLAKIIVDSFTNLLFGEDRFPVFRCEADEDTEDFANTIAKVGELPTKIIRARNLGGAMGGVGMSWSWAEGRPRFDVHNLKNLFVHTWADREKLWPKHLSEVFTWKDTRWNGREFSTQYWWYRRDWTPDADIVFKPCPYEEKKDPFWVPDLEKSYLHNDGVTHFEWIQNLPTEDTDGLPDYEGLYESFDSIDLLMSVVTRGATLNLDPTLILKMDAEQVSRMGIRKGSDNAITVGKDGDANYLELAGEGIKVGIDLINAKRRFALETAQCVVPDPNEVAAQGISSIALKALYAPMIGKCNVLREQYGRSMKRMLEIMIEVARSNLKEPIFEKDETSGLLVPVQIVLDLPPKVEKQPVPEKKPDPPKPPPPPVPPGLPPPPPEEEDEDEEEDDTIDPEEDPQGAAKQAADKAEDKKPLVTTKERVPGDGEEVDPKWGEYFQATPDDLTKVATALQGATGGKGFVSQQTAAEYMAQFMGVDPAEEWKRVDQGAQDDKAHESAMSNPPATGGAVPGQNHLPPGAAPKGTPAPPGGTHPPAPAFGKPPNFGKPPPGGG